MNKAAYDVLVKVRDKIFTHRKRWTKGDFARNAEGNPVDEQSRAAVCWCLYGAIRRAGGPNWENSGAAIDLVSDAIPRRFGHISHFNDAKSTTITDVRKVLAKAIKLAADA